MTESDYVELHAQAGVGRLIEGDDGWWVLDGASDSWSFSRDEIHGFLTSFEPPGGPLVALGSVFITARGRHLVVASILIKGGQLKVILMPEK